MLKKFAKWAFTKIYFWAMGVKGGEDATVVGVYYVQEWE